MDRGFRVWFYIWRSGRIFNNYNLDTKYSKLMINYFDTPEDRRRMGKAFPIYKWLMGGADKPKVDLEVDNTVNTDHETYMEDQREDYLGSFAD